LDTGQVGLVDPLGDIVSAAVAELVDDIVEVRISNVFRYVEWAGTDGDGVVRRRGDVDLRRRRVILGRIGGKVRHVEDEHIPGEAELVAGRIGGAGAAREAPVILKVNERLRVGEGDAEEGRIHRYSGRRGVYQRRNGGGQRKALIYNRYHEDTLHPRS